MQSGLVEWDRGALKSERQRSLKKDERPNKAMKNKVFDREGKLLEGSDTEAKRTNEGHTGKENGSFLNSPALHPVVAKHSGDPRGSTFLGK